MGCNIRDITIRHETDLKQFAGKTFSVDAFNVLYQFLASIRQRDGASLTNSKGEVTSHLVGLLSRTTRLVQNNIKLIFVFDGKPPELKWEELKRRSVLKEKAYDEYKKAKDEGDVETMAKMSSRTSKLTPEMVESAKALLECLGIPYIDAPSEGEAQAAHLVKKGDAYAVISQDYDNLLFGVPRLLQNATLSQRRKMPGRLSYDKVSPMLIDLEENLKTWGISRRQLIALGMLVGTDFNPSGIPRIGQKNAMKLVKEFKEDFDALFTHVKWDEHYDFEYQKVFDLIENMPVTDDYTIEFKKPDEAKAIELLCGRFEFGEERVKTAIATMMESQKANQQKSIFDF